MDTDLSISRDRFRLVPGWVYWSGMFLATAMTAGIAFHWTVNRIYVPVGHSLLLRYKGPSCHWEQKRHAPAIGPKRDKLVFSEKCAARAATSIAPFGTNGKFMKTSKSCRTSRNRHVSNGRCAVGRTIPG